MTVMQRPWRSHRIGKMWLSWAAFALLCLAILYPLVRLVWLAAAPHGRLSLQSVTGVLGSSAFWAAARSTVEIAVPSSVLAVIIGAVMAWANARTSASLGWFGQVLPLFPIVVPNLAVATGWVLLGQPGSGFIQSRLEQRPLLDRMVPSIFSLPGLIFVMTLILVPFVYLILQNAFSNLDPALEEASLAAGAGVLRTLVRVSIPALRHAILAAGLLAMIVSVSEYAIPLIIGTPARVQTLSVMTLQFVTASYPPRLGEGAVLGLVLLVTTGLIWLLYFRALKGGNFSQIGGKSTSRAIMRVGPWRWAIWALTAGYFLCAVVLPVGALIVVALQPYWNSTISPSRFTLANVRAVLGSDGLAPAILNSIRFAAIGAAIAVAIIMFLTSAAKIRRQRIAEVGLAVVKIPAAIASLVLGVGMLIAFYGRPFYLGGTAMLLVGAYIVIFLPHASILGEAATAQVRQELIEASEVSGGSWRRTQVRVLFPLTAPAFMAAYALVFAMMSGEASVSRILARPGTDVVGFEIIAQYDNGGFGPVAVLASLLTILNLVVVASIMLAARRVRRRW